MTSKHYMTKTIVIGELPKPSEKKPIEFFSMIGIIDSDDVEVNVSSSKPHHWNYIELICKECAPNLDLMFAYDDADARRDGALMIGRWNDGVVK